MEFNKSQNIPKQIVEFKNKTNSVNELADIISEGVTSCENLAYKTKLITIIDCYDYTGFKGSNKIICDEDIDIAQIYNHLNKKYGWYRSTFLYFFNYEHLIPFDLQFLESDGFSHYFFLKLYAFNFSCNTSDVCNIMSTLEKELFDSNFYDLSVIITKNDSNFADIAFYFLSSKKDIKYINQITKDIFNIDIYILKDNHKRKFKDLILTSENVNGILEEDKKSYVMYCEIENIKIMNKDILDKKNIDFMELLTV